GLALTYPVGDLLLLFGLASVALRRAGAGGEAPLSLVGVGLVAWLASDFSFGVLSLSGRYQIGGWADVGWYVAWVALAAAAQVQRARGAPRAAVAELAVGRAGPLRLLPYAAVLVGYALLLAVTAGEWDEQDYGVLLGAVLLTALLIGRQTLTLSDNLRLYR